MSAPLPLPCPVAACGRPPSVSERPASWLVECYSIGSRDEHAVGVRRATRDSAVRAWNRYVGGER